MGATENWTVWVYGGHLMNVEPAPRGDWRKIEVVARKRGMNTVEDVEEALMRCAVAVGYDEGLTAEDFDVVGVVADMVESVVRQPEPSSEGQGPSADAPGTGGSPNPERLSVLLREAEAREEELREALREIARRATVERNPDGDDQAAATMQLIAREALAKGSSPESRPGLDGRE